MEKGRPPCAGLWNTPMVHLNGDLTTCCLDTKLANRLGNLREKTLNELWNGALLHKWRLAQIRGEFEKSGPYCTSCNWQSAGFYPPERVEAYLEQRGEAGALTDFRKSRNSCRMDGEESGGSGEPMAGESFAV